MHVRQQILNAVLSSVTGLPETGARASIAPAYALMSLPAIAVLWTREEVEDVDAGSGTGPVETRSLEITVTPKTMANGAVQAELNEIVADIEAAVMASSTLRALVHLIEYRGAVPATTGDLQQPAGVVEVQFRALYRVRSGYPETVVA